MALIDAESEALKFPNSDDRFTHWVIPAAALLLYVVVASVVFDRQPLLIDEVVQRMQAAIFAEGGTLRAVTMRFNSELRTPDDVGLPPAVRAPRLLQDEHVGLERQRRAFTRGFSHGLTLPID